MSARITLTALNGADRDAFVGMLAGIYEHSPWVAERAWSARPFQDREALAQALRDAVDSAGNAAQLALIRAHPRLGARAPMSAHSVAEQRGAGLAGMTAEERAQLLEFNDRYERRFGFPFVIAVKKLGVRDIIERCRARLCNDPAAELAETLRQIHEIAGFRLADALRTQPAE
jgi:2-oxo-4-hydroxy-4-carboxy-5-ureidoimidazoline decarboxylase